MLMKHMNRRQVSVSYSSQAVRLYTNCSELDLN